MFFTGGTTTLFTLRLLFFATATTVAAFAQVSTDNDFQVRYFSNVDCSAASTPACAGAPQARPDSFVNISNTGARGGVTDTSGVDPTVPGTICVNVYTFDFREEMASCCSCAVTPNGLISLSVQQDLISKTLTPQKPASGVIKLLATVPPSLSATACNNSAAMVATATLAPGMVAWGTTNHAGPVPGAFSTTETAFTPSTLSTSELDHLGRVCSFIIGQGSGFGICRSCPTLGGQGAGAR
jgi:hypothetical protein